MLRRRGLRNPFPEIRKDFRKIYQYIELNFQTTADPASVMGFVDSGECDLGFTIKSKDFGELIAIPYGMFEMLVVVGKNHRLVGTKSVRTEDLIDEEWILFEKGSWLQTEIDRAFLVSEFAPQNTYNTNDGTTARSLVAAFMLGEKTDGIFDLK